MTLGNAQAVANKIVDAVADIDFAWNGTTYRIGASVGVAPVTRDSNSALGVTGEADAACYAAKRAGRGQVVIYSDTLAVPAEMPVNAA